MKSILDDKKIKITVQYELTTADENLDEDLINSLLDNEPVPHVLLLIGNGTGLEWREYRTNSDVSLEDLGEN